VFLWGSAFAGIRVGLQGYSPAQVALLRFLVASLTLGALAAFKGLRPPRWREIPGLLLLGFLGIAFYNVAIGYAQQRLPASTTSFLVATAPIWMALAASVLFAERLKRLGWLGMALCFAGIGLISLGSAQGLRLEPRALAVLAAAMAQGLFFLGQKPLLKRYSSLEVTTYSLWAGTLLLLPAAPGLPQALRHAPLSATLSVIYLGVFPAALGYVTWAYALSKVPAPTTGSFLYLVPPVAMAVGWVWLGEVPTPLSLLGGALVIGGVVLVTRFGKAAIVQEPRVGGTLAPIRP
jgi:drug/metabolite transporter (DMT)-like permease